MNTLFTNRVHSANPRSIRRPSKNASVYHVKQRPVTQTGTYRSHTDVFDLPAWTVSKTSTPSGTIRNHPRPKTVGISSTASAQVPTRTLHPNQIESLLRSLDHDDTFIVQVDCLANYRTLVQTINLRRTPLDFQSLYALQQHENRIVQRNACRDTRFRSMLHILEPIHINKVKEKNSNNVNRINVSGY